MTSERRSNIWTGETLLGVFIEESEDFPWLYGRFEPTQAFIQFKPLFDRLALNAEIDLGNA